MHTKFWLQNLNGKYHEESLVIDGRKIFIRILREIGWEDMDWIHMAQDEDRWRALGNTVMDLRIP
jgi:hypothetical protein